MSLYKFMSYAALAITAGCVATQDIGWKLDQIGVGSFVTIRNSEGAEFTHLHIGKIDGQFAYKTYRGIQPAGTPIGTHLTNTKGEIIQTTDQNGNITRFMPSSCMRTIGRCDYKRIQPDGSVLERYRLTKATDEGFEYSIFEKDGTNVLSGWAKLDPMGWTQEGEFTTNDGKKISLTMIASSYF